MKMLLIRSFDDFRSSYRKLLVFEYLFTLLTSSVLIPVITFIFNRILLVVGSGILLNSEVYQIKSNYGHMLASITIGLFCSFILFVELCVLIILVQQRYFGRSIAILDAIKTTLIKSPRLIGFGFVQLMFFLLFLIPFFDSPLSKSFYSLFNLPIFIEQHVVNTSFTMTIVYIALVITLLYILLRLIFVLHFMMLEDQSIRNAILSSQRLTRRRRLRLFIALFMLNGIFVGGSFLVFNIISYLPIWLNIDILSTFSDHHSLTLATILTTLIVLLIMPVNIILLTRLFYFYQYLDGLKPADRTIIFPSKLGRIENALAHRLQYITKTRLVLGIAVILYVTLAIYVGLKANENLVYAKWNVNITAHRGDSKELPENSLPSVISAIDKGYQAVEIDVQLTKDGVAVLHHDRTLERMAGSPYTISELTLSELDHMIIGFDSRTTESTIPVGIPTFSQILATAKDQITLLIDLKPYGSSNALVEEVVRQVAAFGMEDDVYIQSFDQATLRHVRYIAPNIKIGQILYFALGDLNSLDVDFYTIEQTMLTKQFLDRAHAAEREVWVWTVNSTKNLKEVMKYSIDGIITDYPERAQSMVELDF